MEFRLRLEDFRIQRLSNSDPTTSTEISTVFDYLRQMSLAEVLSLTKCAYSLLDCFQFLKLSYNV